MLSSQIAIEELRSRGMRLTPQRLALIDVLADNTAHPTAEQIATELAQRVPGISLTTVYKILHEFADIGLVRELDLPGSMRFDAETDGHAHFVCSGCGQVIDVELASRVAALELPAGAHVARVDVVMHGTCSGCGA